MLKITDLNASKELDGVEMAGLCGGTSPLDSFSALLDASTSIVNRVADIKQAFGFSFAQSNSGTVTNNQVIQGGNGVIFAPVTQTLVQGNSMSIQDIGTARVSG